MSNFNKIYENILNGLAKGLSLKDIAHKHNIPEKDLSTELQKGLEVEKEHTNSISIAKEIAMDHLFEDPKYYTKLAKIEH